MNRDARPTEPNLISRTECLTVQPRWRHDSRQLHNGTTGLAIRADRQTKEPINPIT
jgi:hypothetical protein